MSGKRGRGKGLATTTTTTTTTTTKAAWLGRGKPQTENAQRVGRIRPEPERDSLELGVVFRVSCTVSMSGG
jgi:hypothetical protein